MPNDIIRLCTGKSLITGSRPEIVTLKRYTEIITAEPKIDVGSFGLFETAAPNYTTYYPDVTAEDLAPKEADFIHPIVRALSEVIVHKKHNPIDFGVNQALHQSMGLLKGQTINADHETMLGNAMGAIRDVEWQPGYEVAGLKIPPGINAELKIDGKSNPRIARGMMMDPPSIHSVSVTVEFAWEKSHGKMTDSDFFSKLGTFDDKGNMFKRNVTKVLRYHEISLVAHGADPFAQLVNDKGQIINPKYAHITYNSESERKVGMQYYFMDFATDVVKNSAIPDEDIINNSTNTEDMKEHIVFLTALAATMGITVSLAADATEVPADIYTQLSAGATKIKTDAANLVTQTQEVTRLKAEIANLGDAVALKAFQDNIVTKLRNEAIKNYNLTTTTPSQEILTAINAANYDALVILNSQYQGQVEASMPLTCKSCKSTDVSRASAVANGADGNGKPEGETGGTATTKNNADTVAALKKIKKVASSMHGADQK